MFEHVADMQELFDVTFCYFPITFRPPPNDPYRISADDLKVALRGVLSATPAFAGVALPLFLDKFQTSSGQTMVGAVSERREKESRAVWLYRFVETAANGQKDLLQTIAACFPVYGAQAVGERGEEFWELIKTEVGFIVWG